MTLTLLFSGNSVKESTTMSSTCCRSKIDKSFLIIGDVTTTREFPATEDFSPTSIMDFIICFANEGSIKSPSEPLFLVIDISICSNSGLNVITSSGALTFDKAPDYDLQIPDAIELDTRNESTLNCPGINDQSCYNTGFDTFSGYTSGSTMDFTATVTATSSLGENIFTTQAVSYTHLTLPTNREV